MRVPYWRLSSFYFFYFAALGALLAFWGLYLKQIGFDASQIGELMAMLVATKIVAPHFWGWLADRSSRRMRLIRLNTLISMLTFAGFLYRQDYLWIAGVTVCFSLFWNAVLPQFEAATLRHLQAQPQLYSRIRLWGSLGFVCAVLGIGRLLDDNLDIAWLPLLMAGLLACNWLSAMTIPEAPPQIESHSGHSAWRLMLRGETLAFFTVYLLLQISHAPYYTFYSLYLQQYDYSASQTGLLWSLGVVSEIAIFLTMQSLLKRLGPRNLLLLSLVLTSGRWLAIAYGSGWPQIVIAAQLLHAASFGITHVVAMQLLQTYFGSAHLSKAQGLYSGVSFGIGGMLGSYYSGFFWDRLGGAEVFAGAAWICGVALLIAVLGVAKGYSKQALTQTNSL